MATMKPKLVCLACNGTDFYKTIFGPRCWVDDTEPVEVDDAGRIIRKSK